MSIHFQLNLNTNTERVNSLIILNKLKSETAIIYIYMNN